MATHVGFLDEGKMLFEESMGDLADRFREVHVTLAGEARRPERVPAEWLHVRASGNVLSFVDKQFKEESLGTRIGSVCDGVRRVDTEPMGLRSIFTTLARAARGGE
jgi:ABC-2 type transport system ATP-binding protein